MPKTPSCALADAPLLVNGSISEAGGEDDQDHAGDDEEFATTQEVAAASCDQAKSSAWQAACGLAAPVSTLLFLGSRWRGGKTNNIRL